MSVKAKGINIDKVIAEFEKADVDEQIKAFFKMKSYISGKVIARSKELEDKNNELQEVLEEINSNGKENHHA